MASLALNLSRLNVTQNIALADQVLAKMDPPAPSGGGAAPPPGVPGLTPETASFKAARDKSNGSNDRYEQAKIALTQLKEERDADNDALRVEHVAFSKAIEAKAKGNPVVLTASGYPLAADPVQSSTPPGPVPNLTLTHGDADGSLDGSHDRPAGAKNFDVQVTTVDPVNGPYATAISPTTSTWTLTGLTSGQRVWVRVRGNGPNGPGPWSDPATKIVP